jgi:hypothetical protein
MLIDVRLPNVFHVVEVQILTVYFPIRFFCHPTWSVSFVRFVICFQDDRKTITVMQIIRLLTVVNVKSMLEYVLWFKSKYVGFPEFSVSKTETLETNEKT